jgi:hypothetical protein
MKLTKEDKIELANLYEVDYASLCAVMEVESKGSGFTDGKMVILFEAHHFSKFTRGKHDISHPDISSKTWNRALYKKGAEEYARFEKALSIDRTAALLSASYGLGQIMGFNYKVAGYPDVESMFKNFSYSEYYQLKGMLEFIKKNEMMYNALKDKEWRRFALLYNGASYEKNQYHIKLQKAYTKWSALI